MLHNFVPLAIPDLKDVKAFASRLHSLDKHWHGELFGWQAEYTPESDKKPEDSNMTFTPLISGSVKAGFGSFP